MADMVNEIALTRHAKKIIDLAGVQKGDKVLILSDYKTATVGQLTLSKRRIR